MFSKTILYATTNPGKIFEVDRLLKAYGIKMVSLKDLGLDIEVEEAGSTLEENSAIKAKAYFKAAENYAVMADDTGLEIEALNGEPGIHARRWRDGKTRMTDQEAIDYCLYKMKNVPKRKRGARFRTVITLAFGGRSSPDCRIETFDGILEGEILEKPIPLRIEGVPFESLFYIPKWKLVLGEVHQMPVEKRQKFLTHREIAVTKALPRIKKSLDVKYPHVGRKIQSIKKSLPSFKTLGCHTAFSQRRNSGKSYS